MARLETNLKTVFVGVTTEDCPLKPYERLVYSFLAGRAAWDKPTDKAQIAFGTGLDVRTVESKIEKLTKYGLIEDGQVVNGHPEWFKSNDDDSKHWFLNHWHWQYLVPRPDQPITNDSAMGLSPMDSFIYSFLLNKLLGKWQPSGGWSYNYLGRCINVDSRTVSERIEFLNWAKLVSREWQVRWPLAANQVTWFKTKGERPGSNAGRQLTAWTEVANG